MFFIRGLFWPLLLQLMLVKHGRIVEVPDHFARILLFLIRAQAQV